MKASILAIGTELTTGQIINKNASTLSEKLKNLGINVTHHLTVPDEKNIILDSLKYLEGRTSMIFITGGLGPTSDDFTREVVATWANCKMKFDDSSWIQIQDRLTSRGFKVRDMQKQQCYFPEASEILFNREGTANGFKLINNAVEVFVLPGPPREIEAIWRDHIHHSLLEKTKNIERLITKSWDTIGVGESEVAFQVEELLKDRPRNKVIEIGYRVHLPYVEVKISYHEKEELIWTLYLDKIERALAPITVARNFADPASLAIEKITGRDFAIYDFVTEGYLLSRVSPQLKKLHKWSFKQSDSILSADLFENEDDFLALLPFEEDKCILIFSIDGVRSQITIEAPMKAELMSERRKQYFAEMALVHLSRS